MSIHAPRLSAALTSALERLAEVYHGQRARNAALAVEVFTDALLDVDPDVLPQAVREIVREDEYFPKPARLRSVCLDIMRRQRATLPASAPGAYDPLVCPDCRTRYEFRVLHVRRGLPTGVREDGVTKVYATEPVQRMWCECRWRREQEIADRSPSWEEIRSRWKDQPRPRGAPRGLPAGVTPIGSVLGALPGVEPMQKATDRRDGPPDAWEREPEEDAA